MHPGSRSAARLLVPLTALLALLTRLPQFLGGHMLVDGDESVLGLMAKHLAEGRRLPLFLYGQGYGFSLVEAAFGAAAFRLAGVSSESLKAGTLALWTLGAIWLVLAAERWGGRRAAVAAAVALLFCPGWAAWSMKARGGYVTAFAASSACLWLLASPPSEASRRTTFALGLLIGLTAAAQPIALVALLPFLAAELLSRAAWRRALLVAGSAGATLATLALLARRDSTRVWLPRLFEAPDPVRALVALPGRLWVSLSGSHFFGQAPDPGPWTRGATALWCVTLAFLVLQAGRAWSRCERRDPAWLCCAGALAAAGFSLFVTPRQFAHQYLFPVPGLVALGAALAWARGWERGRRRGLLAAAGLAVLLLGTGSLFEYRRVPLCGFPPSGSLTEPQLLRELVRRLESEGIGHVYCDGPLLQWTIAFESRERVLARWRRTVDRLPEYGRAVDGALRAGRPVAIVYVRQAPDEPLPQLAGAGWDVGARFYVEPRVTLETVRAAGFRLGPRDPGAPAP